MTRNAVATATTGKSIKKKIAFLLIVTVAVFADVFKVGEYLTEIIYIFIGYLDRYRNKVPITYRYTSLKR